MKTDDFNIVGSSFKKLSAAAEKACLPRFSLVLGTGFLGFSQDKIQGHSSTFQGLNFRIQGLFGWGQMNL